MKIKNIIIILIGLGVWMLLFNTRRNIKSAMTSEKEWYAIMQYEIKKGEYPATINFDEVITEKVKEGYIISTVLMCLGLIFIIVGIILILKKTSIRSSVKEIGIHLFYWLFFSCLVGVMVSGFGAHFSSCTIDWVYLFLVAGLTGFYAGYLYLYQYFIGKKWKNFFWGLMFFATLVSALSALHMTVWSSFLSGNFSSLLYIQDLLAYGFFSFIAFIYVFNALILKNLIPKIKSHLEIAS